MIDIKLRIDKLLSLGFKWDGKDYNKDDISYNQQKLLNESEEDFNIKFTLIKDKLNKEMDQ
jgi:hypothetical protein